MATRFALLCALGLAGCGPTYATLAIHHAEQALERADADHAGFFAPYDYTHAQVRLAKAREEAAESSYEDAIRLAREARAHAERAVALSRAARGAR